MHRIIAFNKNAWLKPYIDMNRELRKKAKNILENIFDEQCSFQKNHGKCKKI